MRGHEGSSPVWGCAQAPTRNTIGSVPVAVFPQMNQSRGRNIGAEESKMQLVWGFHFFHRISWETFSVHIKKVKEHFGLDPMKNEHYVSYEKNCGILSITCVFALSAIL